MKQEYIDTVRLLIDAAPVVFESTRFAMKGGTALNLFVQDMPRLSVDIDVVFTDHTMPREDALRAIESDLKKLPRRSQNGVIRSSTRQSRVARMSSSMSAAAHPR